MDRQGVEFALKTRKPERANNAFCNRPPPFWPHATPPLHELSFWRGINHIALAQSFPVQAVRKVQDHFVHFRLATRTLRRAEQDANPWFQLNPLLSSEDDRRMFASVGERPCPHLPGLH